MLKLLESIDSTILTPELKSDLEKSINEAIELKASAKAEELLKEKEADLEESAKSYAEKVIADNLKDVNESVKTYLDRVIENFVAESKEAMLESTKSAHADMVIEAFNASLIAAGVDISKIVEAKDETVAESKLAEKTVKYDALVEELIKAEKSIKELTKMGLVNEAKIGLSLVEAKKFDDMVGIIDFSDAKDYMVKLDTLKESIKGSKVDKVEEITESVTDKEAPAWKRFV